MAKKISRKPKNNRSANPAKRPGLAKAPAGAKFVGKTKRKSRVGAAAKPADVIDALVAANARALSLRIDPAWRASVKRNLHVILTHAALVDQFPLSDDIEPAPVFRA